MSWYWNEISDEDSAKYATTTAVWVSYLICVVSGVMATLGLVYGQPIAGLNGWALLDACLFAVVGWRISRLSRTWAVVGLCLYLLEIVFSIQNRGLLAAVPASIMGFIFLAVYTNAVRGTFAYHKYIKLQQSPHRQDEH